MRRLACFKGVKESSNYVRQAGHQIEACAMLRILGRKPSDAHGKIPKNLTSYASRPTITKQSLVDVQFDAAGALDVEMR